MNKKKNHWILLVLAVMILAVIIVSIVFSGNSSKGKVKVGAVFSGKVTEAGWNGMHYQGLLESCDELGAELLVEEEVAEYSGLCENAVKELAEKGVEVIILTSYGYADEVQGIEERYPDIAFYTISFEKEGKTMSSYFVRMYQARYLSGIIAGLTTKTNQIGYVAAMQNYEVNRGISAFALGVKKVNPDAKVIVKWTGSWDDARKEIDAANALIEEKQVDVITYHQNQTNVIKAAEEKGVASIGYHQLYEDASELQLTAAVSNWEIAYREIIREYLQGKSSATRFYWLGLHNDVVALSEYSGLVSEEAREAVEKGREEILGGKDVFSGVIYDNEGNLRCGENEMISDKELLEGFDWFAEGVEFYEE